MLRRYLRVVCVLVAILGTVASIPVLASEPDYGMLGRLALPWPCGEGYEITWGPMDHWSQRKATGIAYDFSLPPGTPLYAPADGTAYFLRDERLLETNLGNYVEIVASDEWLIRLAHLRDLQPGERQVRVGELLGYSGGSGVPSAHLHLEVLVRDGASWMRPAVHRIERFFGLPMTDYAEGAIIANGGCVAQVALDGAVRPTRMDTHLGEPVDLVVPLRNDGLEPLRLHTVQVSLHARTMNPLVARAQAKWHIEGKSAQAVVVRAWPNMAGAWQVASITCQTDSGSYRLLAEGLVTVHPSALKLVGVSAPSTYEVGDRVVLEAWVENSGGADLAVEDFTTTGDQPDGMPWATTAGQGLVVPPGEVRRVILRSPIVPQVVGSWRITRFGYRYGGRTFLLANLDQSFDVSGPQLVLEGAAMYASPQRLRVLLTIANVGTRDVSPDSVEAWGWISGGEEYLTLVNDRVTPLAPGESAQVLLEAPLGDTEGPWRFAEVGYWADGDYLRIEPTEELAALVSGPFADASQPR